MNGMKLGLKDAQLALSVAEARLKDARYAQRRAEEEFEVAIAEGFPQTLRLDAGVTRAHADIAVQTTARAVDYATRVFERAVDAS